MHLKLCLEAAFLLAQRVFSKRRVQLAGLNCKGIFCPHALHLLRPPWHPRTSEPAAVLSAAAAVTGGCPYCSVWATGGRNQHSSPFLESTDIADLRYACCRMYVTDLVISQ